MSLPNYLSEWMFKNTSLECITFKGLNDGKFPKDFWSQLKPSLQVSVQYEPPGDRQVHFLDAAPITRLQTSWSHLFALKQTSNGPSFDRLTVLSVATSEHKSVLEVFWMLRYFPTLRVLHLRGAVAHQYLEGSQDLLHELTEMVTAALPSLQEVTTTSYDFLTALLLDKRPLRRVECQEMPKNVHEFILRLLRTAHSTLETLGFQCVLGEFELLEKIHLFKSLRSLYVTFVNDPWSWSVSSHPHGERTYPEVNLVEDSLSTYRRHAHHYPKHSRNYTYSIPVLIVPSIMSIESTCTSSGRNCSISCDTCSPPRACSVKSSSYSIPTFENPCYIVAPVWPIESGRSENSINDPPRRSVALFLYSMAMPLVRGQLNQARTLTGTTRGRDVGNEIDTDKVSTPDWVVLM